ncbi:hypothetical protein SCHPADRAFT_941727 [Schizopora paradoxa]|uniref:Protein-S-isoprenylcysteine O-methyltransferase n=1 Tax=Schizopora paradoxa TaxID=27342 RepID=A0A0H2RIX4_9AGAM|nr:hypothetical protein SCHPADRAFT_941727 [Schizopora paradoxa]
MSVSFLGLRLSSPPSLTVGASTSTYVLFVFTAVILSPRFMAKSNRESGAKRVVPEHIARWSKLLKFLPLFTGLAPGLIYLPMPFREWALPGWVERFELPDVEWREVCQTVAAGMALADYALFTWSLCVLGRKGIFSPLETKERHQLVDDGPFSFVRHPNYLSLLLWPAIMTFSLWNAAPLFQYLGLGLLLVKIPPEEALLEDEGALGEKYTAYKRRVPYRILPLVW